MNRISVSIFPVFVVLLASVILSNPVFAQASNATDSNASVSPEGGELLKKILSASSFSNIQSISFVDGIEISGINVGDSEISITLKQKASESTDTNASTPVTVTAVRLPGSSVKDVLALVEASAKFRGENTPGPLASMMDKMGSVLGTPSGSNTTDSVRPLLSLMQLGQSLEMGVVNVVGGDWKTPRTVTTGLVDMGELFGMGNSNPSPNARAHFIMVFVVPYVGKTTFGTVPLK
jgi:hypothetical protein